MNIVCKPSDRPRTDLTLPVHSYRHHCDIHFEVIAHPLGEAVKRIFLCGKAEAK